MEKFNIIAFDISKASLDSCVLPVEGDSSQAQIANDQKSLEKYLGEVCKSMRWRLSDYVICAEYTGRYIYPLVEVCKRLGCRLWLESGAEIKLSSGIQRGKSDVADAVRIARYAWRFSDRMRLYEPKTEAVGRLSDLNSERDLFVSQRATLRSQLNDMNGFMSAESFKSRSRRLKASVSLLDRHIASIDREVADMVRSESKLARQYEILTSIKGVGSQIAIATLVATRGFTKFSTPRQFACQIGVAPFGYSSGSSIRGRNKVSHQADKKLKALFHLGAMAGIRPSGQWRGYFERKVREGKNKMSVINAVRSKMVHLMFALIRDDRTFQDKYENSYAT